MKPERKSNEESVSTRELILDATESIMVEEGYSAVTSRRVEEKAGLDPSLSITISGRWMSSSLPSTSDPRRSFSAATCRR